MFIIDVYAVYQYHVKANKLIKIFDLDEIKNKTDLIRKMESAII